MVRFDRIRMAGLALAAACLGALFSSDARALPIGSVTVDCATVGCIGGRYTLDVEQTAPDLYLATYTIDTSSLDVGATVLADINLKLANAYTSPTIVSGPAAILGAGPLNGGGCGGGNESFLCADVAPNLAVGGTYAWQFRFGATSLIDIDEWHLGARYTAPGHEKGWVVSETRPENPVPEPSAALVFGFGMVVAGSLARRAPTTVRVD
jgi:hypothetical protein